MMKMVLDVSCLPPEERTAAWAEATDRALVTTRFRFPEPERFAAQISAMELGPAQLSLMSYEPLQSYRTPRLIRQSDPELYQIALITAGKQGIEQGGGQSVVQSGQFLLYDSSRPFEALAGVDGESSSSLLLQFPRRLMPLSEKRAAPLCGKALNVSGGMGHVFGQTLKALARSGTDLTDADRVRLGSTVVDLAAATIAGHADHLSALPPESRTTVLYHQTLDFISQNLHDPDLDASLVAAAHNISTRTLHRVFSAHQVTVSDTIRHERMSRCRRDLADPALHDIPVSAVGARWGYSRPSDFARAFRAATGTTPTAYRAAACAKGT
ncbi:helix-turn-helix domain-containing protein [Streptomyces globisporus]|uniref:AraC-like ligand-binding domain-containing protein n=1 Tax=Streptomyces globisporus TaxID=1908 RepID=UPI0004C55C96|nr:helix-turn-helix domain-containing protein [Streptomyces globisporus]